MNNDELLNSNEGEKVGEFVWPFYRFSAIIPDHIDSDVLVWLYLSIVVFINESRNSKKSNYSEDVKLEAQNLINEKFSNIIDFQTLEKVVSNAEKHFVDGTNIKEEAFPFLDTFENLFAETCETRMIYQDAVTGEVVPFFGDTSFIEDYRSSKADEKIGHLKINNPSSKAIKNAYEQYIKLKKFNEVEAELSDDYIDEDEQTFLDDGAEEELFVEKKEERKSLNNMDVILIQGTRVELNVLVSVYIIDNRLFVRSPFGKITDNWLNKCMAKGRNVSEEFNRKMELFEKQYCIAEEKITSFIETNRGDFASNLKYCQTIYRLFEPLDDDNIRENIVQLESNFSQGNKIFYLECGRLFEGIIDRVKYDKTNHSERRNTDFRQFCCEIDNKCRNTSLKYFCLKSRWIFEDWQNKYKGGKEQHRFRADMTDIIIRTDFVKSPNMYDSFLEDLFEIWNMRNTYGHPDHKRDNNVIVNQENLDKMTKVCKVLFELL